MGWPVAASQSRMVWSALPEAIRVPSGLNVTLVTASVCSASRLADGLAGSCIPEPDGLVVTTGSDPGAVGTERHGVHGPRVLVHRFADALAGGCVPEPDGLVGATGGDRVPSGLNATEFTDPVCSSIGYADALAGGCIPEPDGLVAAGGYARAVGAERHRTRKADASSLG